MPTETEMLWTLKKELEGIAKNISASCDLLWSGYDVYRFGFKCIKEAKGIEIKKDGCRAFVLSTDNEGLDLLRTKDMWNVAEYDEKRKASGEDFDAELPITCRKEEFKRVLDYLGEECREVATYLTRKR